MSKGCRKIKSLLAFVLVIAFLIVVVTVFVWSGAYNVAATVPHWKVTHWFLEKVREQSITTHSRGITVPSLKDPKLADIGFKNYHAMCRSCHNAPGYSRTEIAKGLNPKPPDFASKDVKMRKEIKLYWIIKNGIKMTGMPAFGPTHSEDELWGVVAFLKKLPSLKPEEYKAMVKAAGLDGEGEDDHPHGHKAH
jgi:mono/diheme cytochrome c family protein